MKVEDELPPEIVAVLNSPEFDDEAGIVIDSAEFTDTTLLLKFSFRYYNEEFPTQQWELIVDNVEEEKIVRQWTQHIAIYKTHPLLLKYTDIQTELYIKGTNNHTQDLFIEIYQSLLNLTGNIRYLEGYVLTPNRVADLSEQGHGLFARGPKTILMVYQKCLIDYGIHAYFIADKGHIPNKFLKVFVLGDSYIIGNSFAFQRQ